MDLNELKRKIDDFVGYAKANTAPVASQIARSAEQSLRTNPSTAGAFMFPKVKAQTGRSIGEFGERAPERFKTEASVNQTKFQQRNPNSRLPQMLSPVRDVSQFGVDVLGSSVAGIGRTIERAYTPEGRQQLVGGLQAYPSQIKNLDIEGLLDNPVSVAAFAGTDIIPGAGKADDLARGGIKNILKNTDEALIGGKNIDDIIRKAPKVIQEIYANDKAGINIGLKKFQQLNDYIKKSDLTENIAKVFDNTKSPLHGLMSESHAQTAARREAGLRVTDVYKGDFKNSMEKSKLFVEDMAREIKESAGKFSSLPVNEKVNIFDYIRTPDRILKKMGMADEARNIKLSWEKYLDELPQEIDKVTAWSKRVKRPEGNQLIFKYLDGQIGDTKLHPEELKVATEIKDYFKTWADKLKLPEDSRITNYITHIWDQEDIGKEFPTEIAALIRDNVAGSVYDPFVQKRLGGLEYKEDTWQALDAYIKRATRKYNMDDVLEQVKLKANGLEDSQFKYIKSYIDGVNMRPTDVDNLIDNFIKTTPVSYKFGQRPTANLTKTARQAVFRGLLGLNPTTALKNLSQAANTYAELGEKYTVIGYSKVVRDLPKYILGKDTELEAVGILRDGFVQDRALNATKKFWENTDKVLFYMFNLAEKINRGAAYHGAKARALKQGKSYTEAVETAKDIVSKTQFSFGAVDTPVALQSDLAKTLTQFMSYTVKQSEFLGEKISKREYAGLIRYIVASLAFTYTIGKSFGMKWSDIIPTVRLGTPPTLQAPAGAIEVATGAQDKYGNEPDPNIIKRAMENKNLTKGLMSYVPAGGQMLKTFGGVKDVLSGESTTNSGAMRYPVDNNPANLVKGALLGQYSLPEAREYYDNDRRPLSENQSTFVRGAEDKSKVYSDILVKREQNNLIDKVKESLNFGKKEEVAGSQKANFTIDGSEVNGYVIGNKFVYLDEETGEPKSTTLTQLKEKEVSYQKELIDAQYTLSSDELKRGNDINGWIVATENYVQFLKEYKAQSTDEPEKLRVENKIRDIQVSLDKYKGYKGFKKPKKGKKISVRKVNALPKISIAKSRPSTLKKLSVSNTLKSKKSNLSIKAPRRIYEG